MMFKHHVIKNSGCVTIIDYPNGSYNPGKKCVFVYECRQYKILVEPTENRTRRFASLPLPSVFFPYKLSHLFGNYRSWYVFNMFLIFFLFLFIVQTCTQLLASKELQEKSVSLRQCWREFIFIIIPYSLWH